MHLHPQSLETVSSTTKQKKPLFVTAGPFFDVCQRCIFIFDISQNWHKLEITSKQGIEPQVFLIEAHARFSFLSSHQHQPAGYFGNRT